MFRWDLWVQGAFAAGIVAVIAVLPVVLKDGITGEELWALLAVFAGGIALFCKDHPPKPWTGDERRDTSLETKK